jgi:mRNA interferase HigB
MRVIKPSTLIRWAERHPAAAPSVLRWFEITRKASWKSLTEIRRDFPQTDMVKVESLRPVFVFNIAGNNFRLIAAVHFNTGRVFLLDFLSHAEYSKEVWKKKL